MTIAIAKPITENQFWLAIQRQEFLAKTKRTCCTHEEDMDGVLVKVTTISVAGVPVAQHYELNARIIRAILV